MAVVSRGYDTSTSRPDPLCMWGSGYRFVCRYVWTGEVPGSPGSKIITKAEADKLKSIGFRVVSNFESWVGRPRDGYAAGQADARTAHANTLLAGGPTDAVIYFSVDFDATSAELSGPVAAYFRGAISVLGAHRVGVYGGIRTVRYLADQGLAKWLWQTYAWSAGQWDPRCHIRQVRNGLFGCGGSYDINEAHAANVGAWNETGVPAPLFTDLDLT